MARMDGLPLAEMKKICHFWKTFAKLDPFANLHGAEGVHRKTFPNRPPRLARLLASRASRRWNAVLRTLHIVVHAEEPRRGVEFYSTPARPLF
jgi:hypothetical protein